MPAIQVVLASASPARLMTLRRAGIEPIVEVSGLDESGVDESDPARLAATLATMKGQVVADRISSDARRSTVLVACDSVLELNGTAYGKPATAEEATRRWRAMRGSTGILHTGHFVLDLASDRTTEAVASTRVHFADVTDPEIAAYVATGEPCTVAGAFTIDGLGGAFVESIDGDPHNVVGISLPLLRRLLAGLGISWTDLWRSQAPS